VLSFIKGEILMVDYCKLDNTNLLKVALGGCFAVLLLVCIGIFTQGVRGEVEFDIQSAADSPLQSYLTLNDVREAVPVSSGRFQLSRILQQLQGRLNGFSRLFTPRELFKSLQEWHWLPSGKRMREIPETVRN
jgi:hypothetical protein